MNFDQAMATIVAVLQSSGTNINADNYDGIIVKKLEASNTLDEGRTTNQTHIAITGAQMDIFPYLRSDGYFDENDAALKKYFITHIPVKLFESNIEYLAGENQANDISFTNGEKCSATSVVRSKRQNQADQIQVSFINFDEPDFVTFRHLLPAGTYLIMLKRKRTFEYEAFGIKEEEATDQFKEMNNQFYKLSTNTVINVQNIGAPDFDRADRLTTGNNTLLYGVPGSGKSWTIENEYCHKDSVVERLVFHPDYTNADFVGQILPVVDKDKQVTYEFTPGPFTSIMRDAYRNPKTEYILVIEEINRGNAPAIFGEVFQLLDRKIVAGTDGFPIGTSEYGITHKYMAEEIYGDEHHKVRIPSNLSILGTMNTSDQNVFTLDTAFQRRWRMRLIENNFDNVRRSLADVKILDTEVTWRKFCDTVNDIIIGNRVKMASAEDKRLGVYFIHESEVLFDDRALPSPGFATLLVEYNDLVRHETLGDLTDVQKNRLSDIREAVMHNRMFPEKIIKYLWDDAFKFNPEALFDTDNMDNLEKVIRTFVYNKGPERFRIFKSSVRSLLYPASTSASASAPQTDGE